MAGSAVSDKKLSDFATIMILEDRISFLHTWNN